MNHGEVVLIGKELGAVRLKEIASGVFASLLHAAACVESRSGGHIESVRLIEAECERLNGATITTRTRTTSFGPACIMQDILRGPIWVMPVHRLPAAPARSL